MPERRNGTLDVMRILAAVGIVWFHAKAPYGMIAYSGLSLFFLLLIALPVERDPPQSVSSIAGSRADRLLRPWLVWSLVIAVLKIGEALSDHRPIGGEFAGWMIFTGPQLHLWFLPFGFFCVLLTVLGERKLRALGDSAFAISLWMACVAMLASAALLRLGLPVPIAQWTFSAPAVLFALSLRLADGSLRRIAIIALVVLATYGVLFLGARATFDMRATMIGLLIGLLGFAVVLPSTAWLRALSGQTMAVYLLHPLLLSVLFKFIAPEHAGYAALLAIAIGLVLGAAITRVGFARYLL